MDDFLQKLETVVRIVLYGPVISQSNCRKAGPYQLPCNKRKQKRGKTVMIWLKVQNKWMKQEEQGQ